MFRTITAKIGLLVATALIIAAVTLAVSSKFTVESEMMRFEKRMIANILQVTLLEINKDYAEVRNFREHALDLRKKQLENISKTVIAGLDAFRKMAEHGVLKPAKAKAEALDFLRSIRFGNDDYYFAYTLDFTNLAHPRRSMEGKNLYDLQDDQGNFICHEIRRIAVEEGAGFAKLRFPRLSSTAEKSKPQSQDVGPAAGEKGDDASKALNSAVNAASWDPKICYVFLYPDWNWIVGTGLYIDDIERDVDAKIKTITRNFKETLDEVNLVEGGGSIFIFDSHDQYITQPPKQIMAALDRKRHGEDISLFEVLKQEAVDLDSLVKLEKMGHDPQEFKPIEFQAADPEDADDMITIEAFSTYYAPLDWYVVGEVPREYILRPAEKMIYGQMSAMVVVLLVSMVAAFLVVRRILRPMGRLTDIAQQIAGGDLKRAQTSLDELGHARSGFSEETSRLHQSFVHMVESLSELTRQIKKSQYQVAASASEISASARQSSETVQAQAGSSRQANEASKGITTTAEELAASMSQATSAAGETASLAESGRQSLESMENAMLAVHDASNSIADKLTAINDTTANIGAITTTITKISEQTNMLSLNAAIEAEKAGEYGRGFSVVAREIRNLSDRTAMAVLDIEKMVGNVLSAVSSGVMEVESFSHQVQDGANQVKELGHRLDKIIERVLELAPRFEEVNVGLADQTSGASQISAIMEDLTRASTSSAESLEEFRLAAEQLNEAVQGLQTQLAGFKLDE